MHASHVIDLSHSNTVSSFHSVAAAGVKAGIYRATRGANFIDEKYHGFIFRGRQVGMLEAAYHFGNGSNPKAQLDLFLKTTEDVSLKVLDYETNDPDPGNSMSLDGALEFFHGLMDAVGVQNCMIYGSNKLTEALRAHHFNDPIKHWRAAYGNTQPTDCDLWQWTGTGHVPGVDGDCDVSQFLHPIETIQGWWPTSKAWLQSQGVKVGG